MAPQTQFLRVIWMFWAQGWFHGPSLIRSCAKSWKASNADWQLMLLDASSVHSFVNLTHLYPHLPNTSSAAYSDIVRTELLATYGGVWADATVYCAKPLRTWLPEELGFFAFHTSADRPASWFLYAPRLSHPMRQIVEGVRDFWMRHTGKDYPYFWWHETVATLIRKRCTADSRKCTVDCALPCLWQVIKQNKSFSAYLQQPGPHIFAPDYALELATRVDNLFMWQRSTTPVFKLTRRYTSFVKRSEDQDPCSERSRLAWFLCQDSKLNVSIQGNTYHPEALPSHNT